MTKVLQAEFKGALSRVGRSVAGKSALPVLTNVLLREAGGRFELAGTNLDTYTRTAIGCQTSLDGEWAGTVPFKLLSDLVASMPNDAIVLRWDAKANTLSVTSNGYKTSIRGIDAEEFPEMPAPTNSGATIRLNGAQFAATIERVVNFASDEISRPVLTGVAFQVRNDVLTLTATDQWRMARETIRLGATADVDVIVPSKALAELSRLITDSDHVVATLTENLAHFNIDDATFFTTRLIDGQYPDVSRIIPVEYTTRAVTASKDMASATRIAGLFSKASMGVLRLTFEDGAITLSANAADVGDNSGKIEAMVVGNEMGIAVNYAYLSEALSAAPSAQVAIEGQSASRPLIIRPVGVDVEWLALLMPMSLKG